MHTKKNLITAALLSFFIPGLGNFYLGIWKLRRVVYASLAIIIALLLLYYFLQAPFLYVVFYALVAGILNAFATFRQARSAASKSQVPKGKLKAVIGRIAGGVIFGPIFVLLVIVMPVFYVRTFLTPLGKPAIQQFPLRKIHFFAVMDESANELTKGAEFSSSNDFLGDLPPESVEAFSGIMPWLNKIWSQCGVSFELGSVKALRPERFKLGNSRTLDGIFEIRDGERTVMLRPEYGWLNNTAPILNAGPKDHVIYVFGLPLWTDDEPDTVTNGIAFQPGQAILLKVDSPFITNLEISALAHELGHNLGLPHFIARIPLTDFSLRWMRQFFVNYLSDRQRARGLMNDSLIALSLFPHINLESSECETVKHYLEANAE